MKTAADSAAEKIVNAIETGAAKVAHAVRKPRGRKPKVRNVWSLVDAHEWTMRGSGFQRGDAPSGLYVDNVSVAAGEHEANFNSLDITGETVKLSDAQAGQIPAGSYPNARLKVALPAFLNPGLPRL